MHRDKENKLTYDFICFSELVYEFDFSDKNEVEKKIKRRLHYYNLENYKQDRIDYIRQLKNNLYSEISLGAKSKYFHKSKSNFADLKDFDIIKMTVDFLDKYNEIDKDEMFGIINFAIYVYHLR